MAEFVAGQAKIFQSKEIRTFELSERQKHLVSPMYFSQQFTWSAALNFHGAFLLEIERDGAILLSTWKATTAHCIPLPEKWTAKRPVKSSSAKFSPLPILFCRDYHRDACNNANDHYD